MAQNKAKPIILTEFDSANLVAGFLPINPLGLPEACFLIRIINNSDTDVIVSYDGLNDHEFVPGGTQATLNFQTNAVPNNKECLLAKGTVIYVRGTAGQGDIYLSGYYQ